MRKNGKGKWVVLVLLCIPAAYLALQIYRVLDQSYLTQAAVRYTMSDQIECRGILGMTETEVTYDGTGVLGYPLANGERVAVGTVVATVFPTEQQAQNSAYAKQLAGELDTLQKSQGSTTGADAEALLRQTYAGLYNALDCIESGNYSALADAKAQMQLAANRTQLVTGRATDFAARIALLSEAQAAVAQTEATTITAPVAGYFVAGEDSTARVYSVEQLTAMSPLELQSAAQPDAPRNAANVAGKIVADYRWRFYTTVSMQQADKIEKEQKMSLVFPDVSLEKIPAVVESIVRDEENGIAKVVLQCDYINPQVVTQEHADAVLHFRDYEGLRIDKRAERYQGELRGVYVRAGNLSYFRRIEPIFEDETYYLVPLTPDDARVVETPVNEVQMYDQIILEGKNLNHGKVL